MQFSAKKQKRYGITEEQFNSALTNQNNLCALCKVKAPIDVDHDHLTGEFRGLLCRTCNLGIGMFCDSVGMLQEAINYLNSPASGIIAKDRDPAFYRGEKHHSSKLTADIVRAMRLEYSEGSTSYQKLSVKYGIHREYVSQVVRKKAWSHIN